MHYVQYHKEIVMYRSVALEGWTHPTFANPGDLSTSLPPLQQLLEAIESGQCKFVKLTSEQRKAKDDKYQERIKNGEISVRVRAPRKDKGKKRKGQKDQSDVNNDDSNEEERDSPPAKRHRKNGVKKSAERVPADADN
jgi:hypothetical protein